MRVRFYRVSAPLKIMIEEHGCPEPGYSGGHDPALVREWRQRFVGWLRSGQIRFPHTLIPGIAGAPQALDDMVAGRYQGTVLVAL